MRGADSRIARSTALAGAVSCLVWGQAEAKTQPTFFTDFTPFLSSADGTVGWRTTFPYWGPLDSPQARTLANNSEAECYMDNTVGLDPFEAGGQGLVITAAPMNPSANPCHLPYSSGLVTTHQLFRQLYGTFAVRAKLPAGQGLWPAFWLMPFGPYVSELDAFEVLGNSPTTLYFTTRSQNPDGSWTTYPQRLKVQDTSAAYHTYAVKWTPATITLSIDGNPVATAPTPANMNQEMYMLLNVAVGGPGSWPGPPNATTVFPARMHILWARAFPLTAKELKAETRKAKGK